MLLALAAHALLVVVLVGRGSPFATASLDCLATTAAEFAVREPAWGASDVVDGPLGGGLVMGVLVAPWVWAFGPSAWLGKGLAFLLTAGLLLVLRVARVPPLGLLLVAVAPPIVMHTQLIYGNWHSLGPAAAWTAVACALWVGRRVQEGGSVRAPAACLGLVCGLGLLSAFGAAPFLFLAGLMALALAGRDRAPAVLGWSAATVALPLSAMLVTLLARTGGGHPVLARLGQVGPTPSGGLALLSAPFARALHFADFAPGATDSTAVLLGLLWALPLWLGLLVAAGFALRALRRGERGAAVVYGAPVLFSGAYAAVHVVLGLPLEPVPMAVTDIREYSHRVVTPLVFALAVGGSMGWAGLARATGRPAIGWVPVVPLAVAVLTAVRIAGAVPPAPLAGDGPYRSVCADAPAFFAVHRAASDTEVDALAQRCEALSTEARRGDCRLGLALGLGHSRVRVAGGGMWSPCHRAPPDLALRCEAGEGPLGIVRASVKACDGQPGELRALCLLGAGWFSSELSWQTPQWPGSPCATLGDDAPACWGGVGFQAVDHLQSTPARFAAALDAVPEEGRVGAAWGAGVSLGRTWADGVLAERGCAPLTEPLRASCLEGVALALAQRR